MKEAYLYERVEEEKTRCKLCSHRCLIADGKRGICGVRENRSGTLFSLVYEKVIARNIDPIEKKPLFHFLPATRSYSIATAGCNFRCKFCQNSDISQMPADRKIIDGISMRPGAIVEEAYENRCASISYTYTEPTVFFELALDTARIASSKGIKNVFVSNGYMTAECLEEIGGDLHAANVDLKAFSDRFYKEQCGARLKPVLATLENMKQREVWLEVTTLLIPGLNDSPEELKSLARFLAALDPYIPWHISRFHPRYKLTNIDSTPAQTVRKARDIGYGEGLKYVYTGNLPGDDGEKTYCHGCGELLIDRTGFYVNKNSISSGKCPGCGKEIPGIWTA
ncbi:MAG: AmmeMemoRadiSam system radical SAM enzyme [Desulfobacteraceae bacterium]|nr:MAG: AmmeMemoRadiSam system radical SAM enzyme [Desulfobacteraceae bacterium]